MKVLIPNDWRGHRDSPRRFLERERAAQVAGVAQEAGKAPANVIARELRHTLDRCPICDGGYRDHAYAVLATVAMQEDSQSPLRLKQYYDLLHERRWRELLDIREWNDTTDILAGFAFRCVAGRIAIVTMLCPCKPDLPDTPLHHTILPEEEGKSLAAFVPPEQWLPLRPAATQVR